MKKVDYDENLLLKFTKPLGIDPTKSMDAVDILITNIFLKSIEDNFYQDRSVIIHSDELKKYIAEYCLNKKVYDFISERCSRLISYSFTIQKDSGTCTFKLFDHIDVYHNGTIIVVLGKVILDQIIKQKH